MKDFISKTTYHKIINTIIIVGLLFPYGFAFPEIASANFNEQINYQGKLTNSSNTAVADGLYHMKFRLYTQAVGGSHIWEDDRSAVVGNRINVTNGLFSVLLGSSTPLTSVNFNQDLWLEVEIGGTDGVTWETLSPRKKLGAVPASFEADRLDGLSSEQFLRSDAVNATTTASTYFTIIQNGAGKIAEFFGPSSSSVLSVTSTGRVGIGSTTPNATLSVNGNSYISGTAFFGGGITSTSTLNISGLSTLQNIMAGQATTTNLAITNITSSLLKTNASGSVVPAILGTDFEAPLTFSGGLTRTANNIAPTSGYNIPLTASTTDWNIAYINRITSALYPLQISSNNISLAFGTTTANTWSQLQIFNGGATTTELTATGNTYLATLGGRVGIGSTSPSALLSVQGETLAQFFTAYGTTSTTTIAGNLSVGGGALTHNSSTGVTSIDNLALGNINFEADSGIVSWIDMPVTSASTLGTVNSYTAQIDGNPMFTIYSESDGVGGTQNRRIGIGTTTPFAKLSVNPVAGDVVSFVIGSSTATQLSVSALGFGTTTLSGLNISGQATTTSNVGINLSGGCFAIAGSCLTSYSDSVVNAYIHASTTIPKTYTANTFTALQTLSGGLTVSGNTTLSSVAINSLLSTNASGIITATSTPTFGNFNATSTTATSTISTGGFTVGNSQFIVQQNSGRVGIGTTNPQSNLHLYGASTAGLMFGQGLNTGEVGGWFTFNTTGNGTLTYYGAKTGTGYGNFVIQASGGNVGIGTTSPSAKLSVKGGGTTTGRAFAVSDSADTERFTILDNGNVGVGTVSPSEMLHVYSTVGSAKIKAQSTALSSQAEISFQTVGGAGIFSLDQAGNMVFRTSQGGLYFDNFGSGSVIFRTGGANQRLTISGAGNFNFNSGQLYIRQNDGNVGIGTTSPYAKLSIHANNGETNTTLFNIASSTGSATTSLFTVLNNGKVGVGTASPSQELTVIGTAYVTGNYIVGAGGGLRDSTTQNQRFNVDATTASIWTNNQNRIIVNQDGNVGIGTTTPNVGFHVNNAGDGAIEALSVAPTRGALFGNSTTNAVLALGVNGGNASWIQARTKTAGGIALDMTLNPLGGNVGIGVVSPGAKLAIQGSASADIFRIATSTGGTVIEVNQWGSFIQRLSSTTAFSIQTSAGSPVFEVDTSSTNNSGIDITASAGQTSNLLNMFSSGGTFLSGFTASGGLFMNISSTTALNIQNGSGSTALVVNSASQSVGIGTSTLTYTLNVDGDSASSYIARINNKNTGTGADGLLISLGVANASRTTGNYFIGFSDGAGTVAGKIQGGASAVAYTTSGADLAEYFRVADTNNLPVAGEIVMLDQVGENAVLRADYQTLGMNEPVGIVSTNPGFVGNGPVCKVGDIDCDVNYEKYNVLVALVGQVPVKVSNENGDIAVGDYLTLSSTTPGVAVKMIESGYTVGRALTLATTTEKVVDGITTTSEITIVLVEKGWRDVGGVEIADLNGGESLEVPTVFAGLFNFLKKIGLEIGNNFVKLVNLVVEKITAQRVETEVLCLDDVCITKTELQQILNSAGQSPAIDGGTSGGESGGGSTDDNTTSDDTSGEETVSDGTTVSETPVEEPVEEPAVEEPVVEESVEEPVVEEPVVEAPVEPSSTENP